MKTRSVAVSRLFGLLLLGFTTASVVYRLQRARPIVLGVNTPSLTIMFIFGIFFLALSFFGDRRRVRIVQVGGLVVYGTLALIFIVRESYVADLSFLLAGVLAYRYGMFGRRPGLVLMAIFGPLVVARVGIAVFLGISGRHTVNQILITGAMVVFLHWIFEEELQLSQRERDRLERLQRDNQPFVEFGRNVAGIVHDFRNDLSLFASFGQLLEVSRGEPITEQQLVRYRGYVARLQDRIERILYVTRVAVRQDPREVDLNELIASTLYVFQANLEFKRLITFNYHPAATRIVVRTVPAGLVTVLENLIRNSCEALVEAYGDDASPAGRARIDVTVSISDDSVRITLRDNGPGIAGCSDDEDCLSLAHPLVGSSTKSDGTGLGLTNVVRGADTAGATVRLRNAAGRGVRAEIDLPSSLVVRVEASA